MATDLFTRKMLALDRALPRAGLALVTELAAEWAWWVSLTAPRDTQRFANGWALAARAAGLSKGTLVKPMETSAYFSYQEKRLIKLVSRAERDFRRAREVYVYWSALYNRRYREPGRKGAWERQTRQKVQQKARLMEKQEKVLNRAREALTLMRTPGGDTALYIGGKGLRPKELGSTGKVRNVKQESGEQGFLKLSNLTRVIKTVYGGSGAAIDMGNASRVVLHNLEPHASIVENRTSVGYRAREMVRQASGSVLHSSFKRGRAVLLDASQLRGRAGE